MKSVIRSRRRQVLVWLIWVVTLVVFIWMPEQGMAHDGPVVGPPALAGLVSHNKQDGPVFPWQPKRQLRKWAWRRYCAWRRAHGRAVWVAHLARLALTGALTLAQIVDGLTQSQLRRHVGALPMLYALLETLQVREIINRYCPTAAEVDHGTVAMVLILNRLVAPRPLYHVADWLARTVLVQVLGVPAQKFNDDRLARTLDAISQHTRDIWQEIVHRAFVRVGIDLTFIFYDLTAFVVHGEYANSQHADFGFAHNTPLGKRKVKVGLNVTADGNLPTTYQLWPGRTADKATVQENMERLCRLLKRHGWQVDQVTLIGDRANLNDELALAYADHRLRYLTGLQPQKKRHRELLVRFPEQQFYAHPLTDAPGPKRCWGLSCPVVFQHQGRQAIHRGLVVLSGPMRTAQRLTRAAQLRALRQALQEVEAKIGQPHYRTRAAVQRRADTRLKNSPVGKLMRVEASLDAQGQICLRRWVDRYALWQTMQRDGRYLLVTNDDSLSPRRMLALYRQKDGVEQRFRVSKSDLKVAPIYLHKDERIAGLLLINMLALLTYSLLERQVRQRGVPLTTRRIIQLLESLDVIETLCWDASRLYRIVPIHPDQAVLLNLLAHILTDLRRPRWPHAQLPDGVALPLPLPPPGEQQVAA